MQFIFNEDQEFFRESTGSIARDLFAPTEIRAALEDDSVRSRLWSSVNDLGWGGLLVPEDLGGSGGTVIDACIVAEALGRSLAPVPFVASAFGVATLAVATGSGEVVDAVVAGRPVALALDRTLRWPGGECLWDWVPRAQAVGWDGGKLALSDARPAGFERMDPLHPIAWVDPSPPATAPDDEPVRRALATIRVGLAATAAGLAAAALDEAVAYAKEREQYGQPIGNFQAIQHICADMLVDVDVGSSLSFGAAWSVENEPIDVAEHRAAAAMAWCLPAAVRTVESGIQVLGGIGVTWEHDAHLRLRHARLLGALLGGAADAERDLGMSALEKSGV